MSEHTPTPWATKEEMIHAEDGDGRTIATMNHHQRGHNDADAEFIVRAVNAHDKLLAVLEDLLDDVYCVVDFGCPFEDPNNCMHTTVMAARAAIAKAEAKP